MTETIFLIVIYIVLIGSRQSLPATLANQITQLVTTAAAVSTCPVIVDAALMPVLPW